MTYHALSEDDLNQLCCLRLGWELRDHLWEYGSVWHEKAWFKGDILMGFPNFLIQDPVLSYLEEHLVQWGLQEHFGQVLFNLLEARHLNHTQAWFTLAHAPLRTRVLAFLQVTEQKQNL
ncbi:hypothetical protein [Deinococcus roseus]|uniref:hypothetical protein n=1 Tax=Deinococcus roseus TaxID=392414 RepID=UPI0016632313|nr:hypothetical protein [Deinococcus roseus]